MLIDDVTWIAQSFFRRFRYGASDIRAHILIAEGDIRLRSRRVALGQVFMLPFVFAFSTLDVMSGGPSFGPARQIIGWLWAVSLAIYIVVGLFAPRLRRAVVAHAVASLVSLPLSIACFAAGLQAYTFLARRSPLGLLVVVAVSIGLAVAINLPKSLASFFRTLASHNHRVWLRRSGGNWDPEFVISSPRDFRLGCLLILLSAVATPLGLHLDRVVGRTSANGIVALLLICLGAIFAYGSLRTLLTYTIAMRQVERRRSMTLILPPYDRQAEMQAA